VWNYFVNSFYSVTAYLVLSGSNSYLTAGRGTPGEAWPPY
jgi:hypothetical protein